MSLTPFQARLALSSVLLAGTAIATNILYLQDQTTVSSAARAKSEQMKLRAEADRIRRLALEPQEAAGAKPKSLVNMIVPIPAVQERTGRFAPSAGQLERAAMPATESEMRMPEIVKGIQQKLVQKGYEPGTPDGVTGVVTRAAIMAYEHDHGLQITGEPSDVLLQHMQAASGAKGASGQSAAHAGGAKNRPPRSGNAEQITRTVQQSLAQLGYFAGKIDGRAGDDTVRSIREYEMDAGLTPSGRVSAPLLIKLARSSSGQKPPAR